MATPYADISNSLGTVNTVTMRGRLVLAPKELDLNASTPWGDFSQQEIKLGSFHCALLGTNDLRLPLGEFTCDDEGYFDTTLDLTEHSLDPGIYTLEASYQDTVVGQASFRLLATDHSLPIIRSDIDKTYLDTRFKRKRDALGLLFQNATERAVLPAMEIVYRSLQRGVEGDAHRPLIFLSGSPRFFKRVLEARILMDGLQQHGVLLKPFKEIAARNVAALSVRNIVPAFKEQIGYKLTWLLSNRLELPTTAPEILMGDDSEADFVVYNLYHRLTARELSTKTLLKLLKELRIAQVWLKQIDTLATSVLTQLADTFTPVQSIYINKTGHLSESHNIQKWIIPNLVRVHDGAWPLTLDLFEEGYISNQAVHQVKQHLLQSGFTTDALLLHAYEALDAGYINMKTFEEHHLGDADS